MVPKNKNSKKSERIRAHLKWNVFWLWFQKNVISNNNNNTIKSYLPQSIYLSINLKSKLALLVRVGGDPSWSLNNLIPFLKKIIFVFIYLDYDLVFNINSGL